MTDLVHAQASNAVAFGYSQEQIDVIRNQVAKGTNDTELQYFLAVSQQLELDPITKEIWCIKNEKRPQDPPQIFTSRDGLRKNAYRTASMKGYRSSEVCVNDSISMRETGNTGIQIDHTRAFVNRGEIIGAYAIGWRHDSDVTFAQYVEIADYSPKTKRYASDPWFEKRAAMIRKVAEVQIFKAITGLKGVYIPEEFGQSEDVQAAAPNGGGLSDEQIATLVELAVAAGSREDAARRRAEKLKASDYDKALARAEAAVEARRRAREDAPEEEPAELVEGDAA